MVSGEAGRALAECYAPPRILEAIFTVGRYGLICGVASSCGILLEPGLSRFPEHA